MIKAIIRKELRENLKVAVPGMICFALLALYIYHSYSYVLASLDTNISSNISARQTQPLLSGALLLQTAWLAGILGVVLGWMQIHSEHNRDLWAFLMHRPVSRTKIFFGKVIAGLALYLLASGLPLAGFVIWDITPGHVAAPFEWGMVAPLFSFWLSGTAFYFAGMLTGVRSARWYASRALGIGLAGIASVIAFGLAENGIEGPPVWMWPAAVVLCAGILAVAAWGSFVTGGRYEGQSRPAKAALILTIGAGSGLVIGLAFGVVSSLLEPTSRSEVMQNYVITEDGKIYRETTELVSATVEVRGGRTYTSREKSEFHDLDGNLILSPKTGKPMDPTEFYTMRAGGSTAPVNFGEARFPRYYQSTRYMNLLHTGANTVWYFWRTTGRVVGYNVKSRLAIGSVGPEGFATTLSGNGGRFVENYFLSGNISADPWRMFQTATSAYIADLDNHTFSTNFTTTADDPIGGTTAIGRTNIVIVTRQFIHLLTGEGHEQTKLPYQPGYPAFADVTVWALQPAGRFVVWFQPTPYLMKTPVKLHTHAVWLAENGAVTAAMDLPDLPLTPQPAETWMSKAIDKVSVVFAPVPTIVLEMIFNPRRDMWTYLMLSSCGTITAIGLGWWLGSRYRHSRGARIGWGIFHLVFNLVGLLTFVFVQEWPKREKCPNCKKLRVVDHGRCEHCGGEFARADKNGTEIFEPLGVSDSGTV